MLMMGPQGGSASQSCPPPPQRGEGVNLNRHTELQRLRLRESAGGYPPHAWHLSLRDAAERSQLGTLRTSGMKSTKGGSSGRGKGIPTTGSTAAGGAAAVTKAAQGGAEGYELKDNDLTMEVDQMLTDWDEENEDAETRGHL